MGLPVFAGSAPGIANFDRVDDHVYRGGQPTGEGFKYLAEIGVKTIIDLREADGRAVAEQRAVTGAGMRYINVPMTGLTPPTEAEITKILTLMRDSTAGPVFVHCKRGADRTGAVVAAYHIAYHQWDNSRALKDAKAHGMGAFQFPRQSYISKFRPSGAMLKSVDASVAATPTGDEASIPATVAPPAAVAVKN